jgi:integrase
VKLTDTTVAELELPAGKTEHFAWDDDLPGFGCRLRAGTKRWYIQYRAGRQQRRESLGDVRKVKLAAARSIARKRFAQVELGADPAADRAKTKAAAVADKLNLGLVADRYLKAKEDRLRPSTFEAASRYFRSHWASLRELPIGNIKRANIAAALQEITAKHGRVAASRARANLSALFGWAMKEGLCDVNPVIVTNDPAAGITPRERVLEDQELRAVWNACLDDPFGRVIKLLTLTGCRRSEIGDLKWSEVDLDSGVMTIPGTRTKNRRTLTLTLAPMAIDILRTAPRRDDQTFVFGKNGSAGFNAWSYSQISLNNRIAGTAGRPLPHWTIHDLRRTARSGLGKIGIAPHIAERVIGHTVGKIEAVYDRHTYAAEIKTALLRWSETVASIVEDQPSNVVPWRS